MPYIYFYTSSEASNFEIFIDIIFIIFSLTPSSYGRNMNINCCCYRNSLYFYATIVYTSIKKIVENNIRKYGI